MFDQRNRGKIKNSKIQAWRAEMGMFSYEVKHRSGKENVAADALSRVCSVACRPSSLKGLHESLATTRLLQKVVTLFNRSGSSVLSPPN